MFIGLIDFGENRGGVFVVSSIMFNDTLGMGLFSSLRLGLYREGSTWLGIKGELGFDKLNEGE